MPRVRLTVSAIALGLVTLNAQQAPVFRSAIQSVSVYATAQDGDRLVTDLTRDDFQVLDNGRPQPLTIFDNGLQPISVVIMLDTSGSMVGNLGVLRSAAVQLFTRLLPGDKARIGNFGDRITLSPAFTNDQNELIRTLWLEIEPGGPTPLWGAVNVAMTALARLDGRRVVLVLSDGKDTGGMGSRGGGRSFISLDDVSTRAQAEDFMIYAIGFSSRGGPGMGLPGGWPPGGRGPGNSARSANDGPDPGLRRLASESGGGYFEVTEHTELGPAFARIADELHRQYLLGFAVPERDGKAHKIEVRASNPALTVRARKSYLAPRG